MLRIHDRLRKMHVNRVRRRKRIHDGYDPRKSLEVFHPELREVEGMAYLDPCVLDDFEDAIAGTILAYVDRIGLARTVSQHVADNVLGDRVYRLSLARQIGVGCNAAALLAIEERVLLAAIYVMRELAERVHEAEPTLPSAERLALSFREGKIPRQYAVMRDRGLLEHYHAVVTEHPDWTMSEVSDALDERFAALGVDVSGDGGAGDGGAGGVRAPTGPGGEASGDALGDVGFDEAGIDEADGGEAGVAVTVAEADAGGGPAAP